MKLFLNALFFENYGPHAFASSPKPKEVSAP